MERRELLYEGKAKQVSKQVSWTADPDLLIEHLKNDTTCGMAA